MTGSTPSLRTTCSVGVLLLWLCTPGAVFAQAPRAADLGQMSLEDLMNVQVTSVSKKEQKLSRTAASIYVIDQAEIRRSGATNIPDLLRGVPGVDVAQMDGGHWVISIRGFSDLYGNKVLVLIDGRSAYRTTFSGVRWDEMDMVLEDIERIEVIRGPGGTVWGANAMNGVINIITKSAEYTRGGLVSASAGSRTNADGVAQYGGSLGSGSYRGYSKYFNIGNEASAGQAPAEDGSHGFHAGFRADWTLEKQNGLVVQGDIDESRGAETLVNAVNSNALPMTSTFRDEIRYTGGNVLGRWNHAMANGSEMSLQVYDDYFTKTAYGVRESSNTVDVDFHHRLVIGSRNEVVWGLGIRTAASTLGPGYNLKFLPPQRTDNLESAFIQDEITIRNSLFLTLGSKFEHNSYTGFEYEPSAQLAWVVNSRHTVWASAARAIRQPARLDSDISLDAAVVPVGEGSFGVVQFNGSPNLHAEELRDFEIGHRTQISKHLSVDSVAFLSLYRRLEAFEPHDPFFTTSEGPPHIVFPQVLENSARAHNYGAEFFATWSVNTRWRLSSGLSALHLNLVDTSGLGITREDPGISPRHMFQARSLLNLRRNLDWDASVSQVGRLTSTPGYARLDSRLGWRLAESVELSLVGQNLLTPRHAENADAYLLAHTLIQRRVFATIVWRR
jgi:iron complex outermembrane receptor protein